MRKPVATVEEMRVALRDLAMMAGTFTHGGGRRSARRNLSAAIGTATEIIGAEVVTVPVNDPDQLISQFIKSGGDWHQLVAAINRSGRRGASAKHQEKKND